MRNTTPEDFGDAAGAPLGAGAGLGAALATTGAATRFGAALRRSIAVVTYTGRRSGRTFSIPVAYRRRDDENIDIGANLPDAKTWWRNFLGDGAPLSVTLDGVERTGHGVAHRDDKGRVTVSVCLAGS